MNKFETLAKVWAGTMLALALVKATETPTQTFAIEPTGTPTPSAIPLVPTETPTPTPTIPWEIIVGTPQAQLYATVDALKMAGLQNSFVPEGEFTKELYEQVAKATFPMFVDTGGPATSFVVGKEGNTIYLVTARHVLLGTDRDNPKISIVINIGSTFDSISLKDIEFIVSETRDIALVRATIPDTYTSSITPIAYQDNYILEAEQRVLAVGWPFEFWQTRIYTSAGYFLVASDYVDANEGRWATGLGDNGSSGSPVIVPDTNGNPVVIGIITGGSDQISYPNGTLTVTRNGFIFSLEIDRLKRELENK